MESSSRADVLMETLPQAGIGEIPRDGHAVPTLVFVGALGVIFAACVVWASLAVRNESQA